MHELPVIEKILDIVLNTAHKHQITEIRAINLEVGELSHLEQEWMQHYFDYLSQDSIAQGAKLKIDKIPAKMRCSECENELAAYSGSCLQQNCTFCGSTDLKLISGNEYYIKNLEAI